MTGLRVAERVCAICGRPDSALGDARAHAWCVTRDADVARRGADADGCKALWAAMTEVLVHDLRGEAARDDIGNARRPKRDETRDAAQAAMAPGWLETMLDCSGLDSSIAGKIRAEAVTVLQWAATRRKVDETSEAAQGGATRSNGGATGGNGDVHRPPSPRGPQVIRRRPGGEVVAILNGRSMPTAP